MESFADKARAFGLALALHLGFVLALLAGLWWTRENRPVVMPGPVIEATLVGPTAAPEPRGGTRQPPPKPTPPPKPAPPPEPEPAPAPVPEPAQEAPAEVQRQDLVEREKVAALAREQAEQAKREEEARVRQQQVLLEQEKQRKLREEQQKQLAEIRRQRETAERKLRLEKERLAQIEDRNRQETREASAAETPQRAERAQTGAGGADNDLAARYAAAIQAAVTQSWNRPESASAGLRCTLRITQIPGGDVLSATVASPCNADAATRLSIEQAVMRAAPLPYQGYEKVFQRSINFNFKYDGQD